MAILVGQCGHCLADNTALYTEGEYEASEREWGVLLRCGSCGKPSHALLKKVRGPDVPPSAAEAELFRAGWMVMEFHPKILGPKIPDKLPEDVATYLRQAADALRMPKMSDACVIMCRRALEAATIAIGGDKNARLAKRIDELARQNRITQDLAEWSHHIRGLGNEAAHGDGPLPLGEEGVQIARETFEFTTLLLLYLFTLPKRVQEARARFESKPE